MPFIDLEQLPPQEGFVDLDKLAGLRKQQADEYLMGHAFQKTSGQRYEDFNRDFSQKFPDLDLGDYSRRAEHLQKVFDIAKEDVQSPYEASAMEQVGLWAIDANPMISSGWKKLASNFVRDKQKEIHKLTRPESRLTFKTPKAKERYDRIRAMMEWENVQKPHAIQQVRNELGDKNAEVTDQDALDWYQRSAERRAELKQSLKNKWFDNFLVRTGGGSALNLWDTTGSIMARGIGDDKQADELVREQQAREDVLGDFDKESILGGDLSAGARGAATSLWTALVLKKMGAGQYGMAVGFGAVEGNEAITVGKDAGLEGANLAVYFTTQAAIETAITAGFTKANLGGFEKMMAGKPGKAIRKGIVDAMKTKNYRKAMESVGKEWSRETSAELAEEFTIELGHAMTEAWSGVNPDALSADQLRERAKSTLIQTILMTAGAKTLQSGGEVLDSVEMLKEREADVRQLKEYRDAVQEYRKGGFTDDDARDFIERQPYTAMDFAAIEKPSRSQWKKVGLPATDGKQRAQFTRFLRAKIQGFGEVDLENIPVGMPTEFQQDDTISGLEEPTVVEQDMELPEDDQQIFDEQGEVPAVEPAPQQPTEAEKPAEETPEWAPKDRTGKVGKTTSIPPRKAPEAPPSKPLPKKFQGPHTPEQQKAIDAIESLMAKMSGPDPILSEGQEGVSKDQVTVQSPPKSAILKNVEALDIASMTDDQLLESIVGEKTEELLAEVVIRKTGKTKVDEIGRELLRQAGVDAKVRFVRPGDTSSDRLTKNIAAGEVRFRVDKEGKPTGEYIVTLAEGQGRHVKVVAVAHEMQHIIEFERDGFKPADSKKPALVNVVRKDETDLQALRRQHTGHFKNYDLFEFDYLVEQLRQTGIEPGGAVPARTAPTTSSKAPSEQPTEAEQKLPPVAGMAARRDAEMVSIGDLKNISREDRTKTKKSKDALDVPTDEQLAKITKELSEGGELREPLEIHYNSETGEVIIGDGNTRLAALEAAGFTHAPVIVRQVALAKGFGTQVALKPDKSLLLKRAREGFLRPSDIGIKVARQTGIEPGGAVPARTAPPTSGTQQRLFLEALGQESAPQLTVGTAQTADEFASTLTMDAMQSDLWKELRPLLASQTEGIPKLRIVDPIEGGWGEYHEMSHTIDIGSNTPAENLTRVFLHEAVHAATRNAALLYTAPFYHGGRAKGVSQRSRDAYSRIEKILYEVRRKYGGSEPYGLKSPLEMITEAFTNPKFQKLLASYKVSGSTKFNHLRGRNLLEQFINAVMDLLGIKSKRAVTALEEVLGLSHTIMVEDIGGEKTGQDTGMKGERPSILYADAKSLYQDAIKAAAAAGWTREDVLAYIESRSPGMSRLVEDAQKRPGIVRPSPKDKGIVRPSVNEKIEDVIIEDEEDGISHQEELARAGLTPGQEQLAYSVDPNDLTDEQKEKLRQQDRQRARRAAIDAVLADEELLEEFDSVKTQEGPENIALRKRTMGALWESMGGEALPSKTGLSSQQYIDDAFAQGIPERALEISAEVMENPRPLTPTESAGLRYAVTELNIVYNDAKKEAESLPDGTEKDIQLASAKRMKDEFEIIHQAVGVAGTAWSHTGHMYQQEMNRKFEPLDLLWRARKTKGKELTAKQENFWESEAKRLAKLMDRQGTMETKEKRQLASEAVKRGRGKKRRSKQELIAKALELGKMGCKAV